MTPTDTRALAEQVLGKLRPLTTAAEQRLARALLDALAENERLATEAKYWEDLADKREALCIAALKARER